MKSTTPTTTFSRRTFTLAASSLSAGTVFAAKPESDALGPVLPRRPLGATGLEVTRYCPGGMHIGWMEKDADAQCAIELAIEKGSRFFDNAYMYGKGAAEALYGKFLTPKYRGHVTLLSKTTGRTAKEAREQLEGGLRRMKTDHIDIYLMHAVNSVEDAKERIAAGVLDELRKFKAEGKVGHIGFSGHRTPEALNWLINEGFTDAEVALMPVNVADPSYDSFVIQTLPLLQKKNIGALAMKTLGNAGLLGGTRGGNGDPVGTGRSVIPEILSVRDAHRFALSLPVAAIVSGSNDLAQMEENLENAATFTPMSQSEREQLIARCADVGKTGEMEFYKQPKRA